MRTKDDTVECKFHWMLADFLFTDVDQYYRKLGNEGTITSGSESTAHHGFTSLHYAVPGQGADIRSWTVIFNEISYTAEMQHEDLEEIAEEFCDRNGIPHDWLEVILEANHHHIEFQPKRLAGI